MKTLVNALSEQHVHDFEVVFGKLTDSEKNLMLIAFRVGFREAAKMGADRIQRPFKGMHHMMDGMADAEVMKLSELMSKTPVGRTFMEVLGDQNRYNTVQLMNEPKYMDTLVYVVNIPREDGKSRTQIYDLEGLRFVEVSDV